MLLTNLMMRSRHPVTIKYGVAGKLAAVGANRVREDRVGSPKSIEATIVVVSDRFEIQQAKAVKPNRVSENPIERPKDVT